MVFKSRTFSPDILERLKPLYALNNSYCFFSVAHDWSIIFLSIISTNYLFVLNRYLGAAWYVVALFLIASRMRGLSSLLHESTHRALAKSKPLNDIMGSVFSGWCVLQSWTGYHYQHIRLHHPYLGNPDKDPDFQQYIQTGLYDKAIKRRDVINYLKSIPSLSGTILYIKYLIKDRVLPKDEKTYELFVRSCFCIAIMVILYKTGNIQNFLLYWIVPLLTTANWIGSIAELLEHYPLLQEHNDDMRKSRNKFCGYIGDYLINPHGDAYHLLHHLFSRIPHWNYKAAHQILMEDENYRAANGCKVGLIAQLLDMLSHFD